MFETAIVFIPTNFESQLNRLGRHSDMKPALMRKMREVGSGHALVLINEFRKTTRTWSWNVEFRHDVRINGDGIDIRVYTDDEIYGYVNNGTSVRYATMSDDFTPKTMTGHIGSWQGNGRMLFVNKSVPRPGIEARNFDITIADEQEEHIVDSMQRSMEKFIDMIFL